MLSSGSSPLAGVVAGFMPRRWAGRSEWLRGVRGRPVRFSTEEAERALDRVSDDFVMTDSSSNAFRLGSPRDPSLEFRSGTGFEPATSGRGRRPVPDYGDCRVPLETSG